MITWLYFSKANILFIRTIFHSNIAMKSHINKLLLESFVAKKDKKCAKSHPSMMTRLF